MKIETETYFIIRDKWRVNELIESRLQQQVCDHNIQTPALSLIIDIW